MKPMRVRAGPKETTLVFAIRERLRVAGWLTEKMHGSAFQSGVPDLFCFHPGPPERFRWLEVKRERGGRLTKAQRVKFAAWESVRLGVWVLTSPDDLPLLDGPANWREWL